nr:hypothetical protein [Propionibacterium sp.]
MPQVVGALLGLLEERDQALGRVGLPVQVPGGSGQMLGDVGDPVLSRALHADDDHAEDGGRDDQDQ